MNKTAKLIATHNRWCGSRTGDIPGSGNPIDAVPPACQIVNTAGITGGAPFNSSGDHPWLYCPASVMNNNNEREIVQGLAAYQPNRTFSFQLDVQPASSGTIRVERCDGHPQYNPEIYRHALEAFKQHLEDTNYEDNNASMFEFYVRRPQAHCERLGFFSNANRHDLSFLTVDDDNLWMKPGGEQANTPPMMDFRYPNSNRRFMWGRKIGPNLCMSLIRPSSFGNITVIPQDFPYTTLSKRNPPFFPGEWDISPDIPEPGIRSAYAGCDHYGGWNPSRLSREGDFIPSEPGEAISVMDVDIYYKKVYRRWVLDREVLVADHSSEWQEGGYDWRFLCAVIKRTSIIRFTDSEGTSWMVYKIRYPQANTDYNHGAMYWDTHADADPPTPLCVGQDLQYLHELFVDSFPDNIPGIVETRFPKDCFFDIKIQAAVFIMRTSKSMTDYLNNMGWTTIVLDEKNNPHDPVNYGDQVVRHRLWCRTVLWCTAKQTMPIPVINSAKT